MSTQLRSFLELSYDELERLNLQAKEQRKKRVAADLSRWGTEISPRRRGAATTITTAITTTIVITDK